MRFFQPIHCLVLLLTTAFSATAQTPPTTASSVGLEEEAQQRYLDGDLAGAANLYLQLADGQSDSQEKTRCIVAASWLTYQSGAIDRARELLAHGLYLFPEYRFQPQNYPQDFVLLYQQSVAEARRQRDEGAKSQIRSALTLLERGQTQEARELLIDALEVDPRQPTALYNVALIDLKAGREDDAIAGFERLLALASQDDTLVPLDLRSAALNNLAVVYLSRGYLEDAERVLREAVELAPDRAKAWSNLGLVLRRKGAHEEAIQALRRALELDPQDSQAANNLAAAYIAAARWAEAVILLQQATSRNPDNANLWLNLGLAQSGRNELDGALASFDQVIQLDSLELGTQAQAHRAMVFYRQGRHAESADAARRALEGNAESIQAWTYLGLAQQASGDLSGAEDSLRRALVLDPARPEIHNNLGNVYFAQQRYSEAEASFRQALTIRPEFPEARQNLQVTLQSKNRPGPSPTTTPQPPPTRAEPKPLGARFADIDYAGLGLRGALVEAVVLGGVADRAGIKKGDLILEADGREVANPNDLTTYLGSRTPPTSVTLDLLRGGRPVTVQVNL